MKEKIKNATILGKTVRPDKAQMLKRVQHDMVRVQGDMCGVQHDMDMYGHCEQMRSNPANYLARSADKNFSPLTSHFSQKAAFTLAEGATQRICTRTERSEFVQVSKTTLLRTVHNPRHVVRQHNKRRAAFTLAEVLITLCIIGVVAAMTMPSLMNKIQNRHLVTALKKSYSILSQATTMIQIEHPSSEWTFYDEAGEGVEPVWELYKPYLKMTKDCGCAYHSVGCWSKDITKMLNNKNYQYGGEYYNGQGTCSAILADGSSIVLDVFSDTKITGVNNGSLVFIVDVNGDKAPNQFGKDVFTFGIRTDKGIIVPAGTDNDFPLCSTTSDNAFAGFDCAAKVLQEGKISY